VVVPDRRRASIPAISVGTIGIPVFAMVVENEPQHGIGAQLRESSVNRRARGLSRSNYEQKAVHHVLEEHRIRDREQGSGVEQDEVVENLGRAKERIHGARAQGLRALELGNAGYSKGETPRLDAPDGEF
jgi:hypothetical protein